MKFQSSYRIVFPWKPILFSSAAILASINGLMAQRWSEWQTLNKTNNSIDISYIVSDYLVRDGFPTRRKFNFKLHNRGSGTAMIEMKITSSTDNIEETTPMIWRDIKGNSTFEDDSHYIIATSLIRVDVTEMTLATPKLGDYQKELTFPDAIDGKWISIEGKFTGCIDVNCPPLNSPPGAKMSFLSRGDGRNYTVQRSELYNTGQRSELYTSPEEKWVKQGNTLTASFGIVYTYSISDNILTMTHEPKFAASDTSESCRGCKVQIKYKRND